MASRRNSDYDEVQGIPGLQGAGGSRSAACSSRRGSGHDESAAAAVCALVSGAACGCGSSSAGRADQPSPSHDELIARTKEVYI